MKILILVTMSIVNIDRRKKTKQPSFIPLYDPVKLFNKRRLLNEIAIKCRYDLMYINDFYRDEGIKFKDNNIFINVHRKYDKDIKDFNSRIKNDNVNQLMERADIIKGNIIASGVFEAIDSMDHTSLQKIKNNLNRSSERGNSQRPTLGEFKQFYKDFKLNEKRKIMKANRELFSFVNKSLNNPDTKVGCKNNRKSSINMSSSPVVEEKRKLKKMRMEQYGKLPQIKKRGAIITNDTNANDITKEDNYYSHTEVQGHGNSSNINNTSDNDYFKLISQTEPSKEFSNISLNSNGMELMKNCLFTSDEIRQREKYKALLNSSLNSSPNANRNSRPFIKNQLSRVLWDSYNSTIEETYIHTNSNEAQTNSKSIEIQTDRDRDNKNSPLIENSKNEEVTNTNTNLPNLPIERNISNSNHTNLNTKPTKYPKKKNRLTFDEKQSIETKKLLSNQHAQLDVISKKIENEFIKFNNKLDKVMYSQEEDDLYLKANLLKSSQDTIKENMRRYYKKSSTLIIS